MQSYKVHANYKPRAWINLDGAIDIHENRDNVSTVNDLEHGRPPAVAAEGIRVNLLRLRAALPDAHILLLGLLLAAPASALPPSAVSLSGPSWSG